MRNVTNVVTLSKVLCIKLRPISPFKQLYFSDVKVFHYQKLKKFLFLFWFDVAKNGRKNQNKISQKRK